MAKLPELLLPAGNYEIAKIAIDHGADAVYIGLEQFSARAKADNFSMEEACDIIDYAHARGAKIFCALNIVLFNEELSACIKTAAQLVAHHVDAFIVQDFGLASMLLEHFPETEVHASTQMAIMNPCGAQTAEALGFDRVVLARECALAEMQEIRAASDIDLEVFVQGALCVCYSGLCYMSSLHGDRSGNRGQCAQPCRQKYSLYDVTDDKEKLIANNYLLSPKDISFLDHLSALAAVPVQSLKIEGRMKQPEYVALMTDIYRKHLDALAAAQVINDSERSADQKAMAQVFNREGFSTAYLLGTPGAAMMSYHTPKNTGIPLGKIGKIRKDTFQVTLDEPLCNGDGVALLDKNLQPLWGGYVDKMTDPSGRVAKKFASGDTVVLSHSMTKHEDLGRVAYCYKTFDKNLSKKLLKAPAKPAATVNRGSLAIDVTARIGAPFAISASCVTAEGAARHYDWQSDFIVEASKSGASCQAVIEKGLAKLKNEGFELSSLSISGDDKAFVPMSLVTTSKNQLAEFFAPVEEDAQEEAAAIDVAARIEACEHAFDSIPPQIKISHPPTITVQVRTLAQAQAALDAGAEELNVLLLDAPADPCCSVDEIARLSERVAVICSLPPLVKNLREENVFRSRIQALLARGVDRFMIANLGQAGLLDGLGVDYYAGDAALNVTNDLTAFAYSKIGLTRQTVSLELDRAALETLSSVGNIPLEMIVYGALPVMHTRYCPMGSLVGGRECDRVCSQPCRQRRYALKQKDKTFPLFADEFCNVYLLNDQRYSLFGQLAEVKNLFMDYWRIAGAFLPAAEVGQATRTLIQLREQLFAQASQRKVLPMTPHSTQGHFFKGVR
ncbi:MAG: DUF3656 domain-containing protein [Peptococcaceae bacterium]|nr:DUF3656 domain-containing protein [Peptococcaceae bacterium]